MSKKMPMIIGLVWLLAATALYGYFVWESQPDGVYTYNNDGCTVDQKVYVTDNEREEGFLYEMDLYGNLTDFFSTKSIASNAYMREAAYSDALYAVMEVPRSDAKDAPGAFVILKFDDSLNVRRMTPRLFLYEGDQLCEFSVSDEGMYLSTVSSDGSAASVYEVSPELLKDVESAEGSGLELESILRRECEPGRVYVDASYEAGSIAVRTDADIVSGPFKTDDSIRYTYGLCKAGFGQLMQLRSDYRIYWAIAVLVGWMLIFLLYFLFHNRNRVVYAAMVLELVLGFVILGGTYVRIVRQTDCEDGAKSRWIGYVMNDVISGAADQLEVLDSEDFYDSEGFQQLQSLLQVAKVQTLADGFEDMFFVNTSDGMIRMSESGRNNEFIGNRYFKSDNGKLSEIVSAGKIMSTKFSLDGQKYEMLAASPMNLADSGYALVGVYLDDSFDIGQWQDDLLQALILFAVASLLCILILVLQSADLGRLAQGMHQVAGGRTDVERPWVYGRDMRSLWSALGEIQKKIRDVNYAKYMTFEAYYRFAPKNIEKLLNKASITEVTCGNVTKLQGTMAMISTIGPKTGSEEEVGRINRLIALIGKYQEEKDGVFVSNDGSLSMLRFLFMERNQDTLHSAIDFLRELGEQENSGYSIIPRASMLLHYSSFVYGIAGTNQQSSAFLVSPDTEEIEHFADWFREHGLRLVISETVKEREHYDGALRCIGYIQLSNSGKKMNMYEVLDAYDVRERSRKQAICEKFDRALELFYQHDFYLARSGFSEILKDLPTDEIAKWYLFTCETYLNMEHAEDVPCCLRYEE